ncbi:hypothetical protein DQ04_18121000 [Trypanosoma grayi]|uniref:hypothetical protein n=1 Tax=Trypanosoma grayi TaxID=71804 RepID=UPI0004F4B374|nr:hypothetical protein DQ04_18121000 [Trypanosoma grayi]KEG05823.1 hypothetical protein DQ04_18121000 [Trypanosoma grayi]
MIILEALVHLPQRQLVLLTQHLHRSRMRALLRHLLGALAPRQLLHLVTQPCRLLLHRLAVGSGVLLTLLPQSGALLLRVM